VAFAELRDRAAERALEALTGETGGEVLKPKLPLGKNGSRHDEEADDLSLKELDRAFDNLAEQLRTQYVLGFNSITEKRDGSFRKLSVRIKKPDYIARANWLLRAEGMKGGRENRRNFA
jgi:hypothetical protein